MSIECGICERDLRGGCPYGEDCPRKYVSEAREDGRDKGAEFVLEALARQLGLDVNDFSWDAATETWEGDVAAVLGNCLTAKFGEDVDLTRSPLSAALATTLAACDEDDATVVSHNLSLAADMFEINRRVIFYNGINGEYILTIEGRCSIVDEGNQLEVTCKLGPDEYKKHFLGLSDNVTYFAEQLTAADVSAYHYRVVFKPQTIIPDIDLRGSVEELVE